ncbi:MAG: YabP/YqfC family sporulation protein [Clostridia bacterium]|jgi:sporulation protein YqfC|nr:YabP/YqfC family sporulation protein [Clostridia bacterium]
MALSDYQNFRAPLSHRICDKLELPEDICIGGGYIEIISNTCALIDGCKGVMEYDESTIKLSLGKKAVCFCGSGLTIKSLSSEQAMIEGCIISMEFCT